MATECCWVCPCEMLCNPGRAASLPRRFCWSAFVFYRPFLSRLFGPGQGSSASSAVIHPTVSSHGVEEAEGGAGQVWTEA